MYFDANGNIDPKWVDSEAQKVAEDIVKNAKKKINSAQLRKFYNEFKTLERKIAASDDTEKAFAQILPHIRLAKAKVTYANHRDVVPDAFKNWLCKHIEKISKPKEFEAFLLHFEAIVGFSYGLGLKN